MIPPCSPSGVVQVRDELVAGWKTRAWRLAEDASAQRAKRLLGVEVPDDDGATEADAEISTLIDPALTLWWVSEEMCDLLYATMPQVPPEVTLSDLQKPPAFGLLVLAKPYIGWDSVSDASVRVDAVGWSPRVVSSVEAKHRRRCLCFSSYIYLDHKRGELSQQEQTALSATGKLRMIQERGLLKAIGRGWFPLGRSDWPIEDPLGTPWLDIPGTPDHEAALNAHKRSAEEDRRLLAAFWALTNARMVVTEERQAPRAMRRSSERAGHGAVPPVRVVYLRRPDSQPSAPDEDGRHVEWSHRWVVSAHPVLQPYGPGHSQRRLIIRGPFIKGPADKPLVVRPEVKAWVR